MDVRGLRKLLGELELGPAFIEHLGWSQPPTSSHAWQSMSARGSALERRAIAELGNAVVLEVRSRDGLFPDARQREQAYKDIAKRHSEPPLVVFVDGRRTKSLWCWVWRQQGTDTFRTHVHLRGQPGRRLVEKVAILHSEMAGRGRGQDAAVAEVAQRLREAMDFLPFVSRFAKDLQQQHELLVRHHRVPDAYAWVLLYRAILLAFSPQKGPGSTFAAFPPAQHLEVREGGGDYGFYDELSRFVGRYSWNLDAAPPWEGEVTPDVVDECFARILRHDGSYRIPPEVSAYLCEQAMHPAILESVQCHTGIRFERFDDLLLDLDANVCRQLIHEVLPKLRFLDPACGVGTLLDEAMEVLAAAYLAVLHRVEAEQDEELLAEVARWHKERGGVGYFIRKRILTWNLFGVDEDEATAEAARVRLLLGLLSTAERKVRSDFLPALELNILSGNALVGLTDTSNEHCREIARTVRPWMERYRAAEGQGRLEEALRDRIRGFKQKASVQLDELLPGALWPRRVRQRLSREDITALRPVHWCLDFGDVLQEHGGFDAILTFPPWEVLSGPGPERDILRQTYPHSLQGVERPALYKFFIERAFQLLRPGGQAAMIVPSSFYADQGSRGLRQWLLERGALRQVLGVSNEYHLFGSMHRAFRFCILVLGNDAPSRSFEVAFRVDPREAIRSEELDGFLHDSASRVSLTQELVSRLSPNVLSIPEVRSRDDLLISSKMMGFPFLETPGSFSERLELKTGLSLQKVSKLRERPPGSSGLLVCGGRTIQQYGVDMSASYWVDEKEAASRERYSEPAGAQAYHLALRSIVSSTNTRTLVSTILPPRVVCDHSVMSETPAALGSWERFFLVALFNSFCLDYLVRQRLGGMRVFRSLLMTLPIPRVEPADARLRSIALRAARLICTTPDFDAAARDVGLRGERDGVEAPVERMRLQAEIEGLVAHLYTLTEQEFAHILSTFPLVPAAERTAARNAYRDVSHGVIE